MDFSRRLYVFTEQIQIFQDVNIVCTPNKFFQEPILCVHRTDTDFPGATILATEQIPIFQELLFSYRTDTDFPGALF